MYCPTGRELLEINRKQHAEMQKELNIYYYNLGIEQTLKLIKGKKMTIDLSKLKSGNTVKFRCGGEAVVGRIISADGSGYGEVFHISYDGYHGSTVHHNCGRKQENFLHPFDIIEIIPAPFNWDDVKWGMGFKYSNDDEWYSYIGISTICPEENVVLNKQGLCDSYISLDKTCLTRSPEHDIEVK